MHIRIYKGHGTSKLAPDLMRERFEERGYDADFIDPETLCDPARRWIDKTDILIFGGQSVTQFKEALGYQGEERIKEYVEQGGHYLGICAGGYFGADFIKFIGSDPNNCQLYAKQNDGLGFFNGLAKGSITDIISRPFNGLVDSAAVSSLRTMTGESFPALYWGGPTFIPYERADRRKILSYLPRLNQSPLIMGLQNDVGDKGGKATLLGYHPEISHANIRRWVLGHESTRKENMRLREAMSIIKPAAFERSFDLMLEQIGAKKSALLSPPSIGLEMSS